MTRRRWLQAAVLLVVGVLILYGLVRSVNPAQVAQAMGRASVGWMALGEIGFFLFILLRGWRWLVILRASAPAAMLSDATSVTAIGFAINSVSPFKLGELIRIGAIAPRARIGVGEAAATVVVERVLDVLALLVIAVAAAAISGGGSHSLWLWSGVFVIAGLAVAIGVIAFLMVSYPTPTLDVIGAIARRLPARAGRFVDSFGASMLKGFSSLRSASRLALASGLSLLVWGAIIFGQAAYFRSGNGQLSLPTLVLACAILTISQAISITPGSVGTYEGFFLLVFSTFGAGPPSLLTAVAVLSHAGNIAALLLAGAVGGLWLRLSRSPLPVRTERALSG